MDQEDRIERLEEYVALQTRTIEHLAFRFDRFMSSHGMRVCDSTPSGVEGIVSAHDMELRRAIKALHQAAAKLRRG